MRRDVKTVMKVMAGFWLWEPTVTTCGTVLERLGFWHWSPISCSEPSCVVVDVTSALFQGPGNVLWELPTPRGVLDMQVLRRIPSQILNAPVQVEDLVPSFALFPVARVLDGVACVTVSPSLPPEVAFLGSWYSLSPRLPDLVTGKWYGADHERSGVYFLSSPEEHESNFWIWLPLPPRQPATQLPFIRYSL